MPSSHSLWDPRTTLKIASDSRCVGWAPSKGRKCTVAIAGHNDSKADSLLREIASQQPDPEALRSKLVRLAGYLLCVRWHQNQVWDMVDDWEERMEAKYPDGVVVQTCSRRGYSNAAGRTDSSSTRAGTTAEVASTQRYASSRSGASTPSRSSDSPLSSPSSSMPPSCALPDTDREELRQTITAMQEALRDAQRQLAELRTSTAELRTSTTTLIRSWHTGTQASTPDTSPASASISRVSTSDISSLDLSRTSTSRSSLSERSAPASSSPLHAIREIAVRLSSRPSAEVVPRTTRTCTRTHVRRRAVDDECPICQDEFLVDDALVWCTDSCGRTVHQRCMEQWRAECERQEVRVTCGICRAVWGAECGCDG